MQLTHTGTRFELTCDLREKDLPYKAGFNFDGKRWWTGDAVLARTFAQFADRRAQGVIAELEEVLKFSRATDADISIPCPRGKSYLPFQRAGIAYCLAGPFTLLADQMGLGKTIQVIGAMNADTTAHSALIITPASLKLNWQKELLQWLVRDWRVGIAESGYMPMTNVVIINYDIIGKMRKEIDARRWDFLACDEAHYLKNPDAKRTKAVLGFEYRGKAQTLPIEAGRTIFVTGTPILNRPIELWPMLHRADSQGLGSDYYYYAKRYCAMWKAPWGLDVSGASNLPELQERLRATFMIRRTKDQVLPELPPKRRQVVAIPVEAVAKSAVMAENDAYDQRAKTIEVARQLAEQAQARGDEKTYKEAVAALRQAQQVVFEEMANLRHATAVAKIPFALDYIENVLEQQEKVVIFCHHRDVLDAIQKKFKNLFVYMHGDHSIPERDGAVEKFQQEKNIRGIAGTIAVMNAGWTLTAASYCLFIEESWEPEILNQCEDRLHRIGQTAESLLIQHLVFDGSLDSRMIQQNVAKQEVIDAALDDAPPPRFTLL